MASSTKVKPAIRPAQAICSGDTPNPDNHW